MNILIYGINFSPELTGIGKYSGEMGRSFSRMGHSVTAVCAPPYYPAWKIQEGFSGCLYRREIIENIEIIRCPLFVPSRVTTLKRILHLASFAVSSFFALIAAVFRRRPDIVFVVVPTLFCLPGALLIAKLCGARTVLHVQDYELEAMFGLNMGGFLNRIRKFSGRIESFLFRQVDTVSTISYSMMELAVHKGVDRSRLLYFPNWVDTSHIKPDVNCRYYRNLWQIEDSQKIVLYSGNIGKKQGLEIIIDAAERMRSAHDVRFIVVGDGAFKDELIALAQARQLDNIQFHPLQPYEKLPALLASADVHLVVQKRGAADVVLPSKLTAILAAGGHSVITADADTELGRLCVQHAGIAELVEPENPAALIDGIHRALARDPQEGVRNRIAREYAERYLQQDAILGSVEQRLMTMQLV